MDTVFCSCSKHHWSSVNSWDILIFNDHNDNINGLQPRNKNSNTNEIHANDNQLWKKKAELRYWSETCRKTKSRMMGQSYSNTQQQFQVSDFEMDDLV